MKTYKVLDHGSVTLIDSMGSDKDVEDAARQSYGKGTRSTSDTRNLIRYLLRHKHMTPFEMAVCKFQIVIPMDCWRQFIRHRTASVNEYSTRYSEAIDYRQETQPHEWRKQATDNKQGSGEFIDSHLGMQLTSDETIFHLQAQELYHKRLMTGVAREQARKDLTLSTYTQVVWQCNLRNILHFLSLRCEEHAQLEIRKYANVMAGIVKELFPITFEAWYDYDFKSIEFSRKERDVLYDYLSSNAIVVTDMGKREKEEFKEKVDFIKLKSQYTFDTDPQFILGD